LDIACWLKILERLKLKWAAHAANWMTCTVESSLAWIAAGQWALEQVHVDHTRQRSRKRQYYAAEGGSERRMHRPPPSGIKEAGILGRKKR
jgi:hypothetical protein